MSKSKEDLLVEAEALGLDVNPEMSNADLQMAIDDANMDAAEAAEEEDTPPAPADEKQTFLAKSGSGMKYYRSRLHGLSVVVKNDTEDKDPTTGVEKVRFQPVMEKYQGDNVKFGYLATNDKRVIKVLATDPSAEEISKARYDDVSEAVEDPGNTDFLAAAY